MRPYTHEARSGTRTLRGELIIAGFNFNIPKASSSKDVDQSLFIRRPPRRHIAVYLIRAEELPQRMIRISPGRIETEGLDNELVCREGGHFAEGGERIFAMIQNP